MPHADRIERVTVEDIRFRFGRLGSGSDANNPETDYSNPYVTIATGEGRGIGLGFTLGRGNDLVCRAVEELAPLVVGRSVTELVEEFAQTWRRLANPLQSRWIAPGAGPYHMAAGAIANGLYDHWARAQGMPLWKALAALEPEQIVGMLDFRYVEHLVSREEALELLRANRSGRDARIRELEADGLPCYHTTWIGSGTHELLEQIDAVRRERGISTFKLKVGSSLAHDRERLAAVRRRFGSDISLLVDANQVWGVEQAIEWMRDLSEFDIGWIEEPTAPDHVQAHRRIREGLSGTGIHVVTGENCPNSHVAAQFISERAVDRFQIDACRVIGPAENTLIMLVAAKHDVPICPHAGGSGLDELVGHLSAFNYVAVAPTLEDVLVEQVGFCADYFMSPSVVSGGRLRMPQEPGYVQGIEPSVRERYRFPQGSEWSGASL
jgi:L-fuconate dehydratase